MSDNDDKLDELFRSRFEDVGLPVSDKLLANIKRELEEPKRKRRFGFWIWIGSAIATVAGIAGVVMYNFNDDKNQRENRIAAVEAVESTGTFDVRGSKEKNAVEPQSEQLNNSNRDLKLDSLATADKNTAVNTPDSSAKQNGETQNRAKSKSGKEVQFEEATTSGAKDNENRTTTTKSVPLTEVSGSNKSSTKRKSTQQGEKEKLETKTSSGKSTMNVSGLFKNSVIQEESLKGVNENNSSVNSETKTEEQTKPNESNISSQRDSEQIVSLDSVASKQDTLVVAEVKKIADTLNAVQIDTIQKDLSQPKNFSLFVEVNGGPSQSFRSFASEANNYVPHKGTEEPLLGYNAGIDAGILFKKKYQVTAGVGIDNKGEKHQFKGREALYNTTYDTAYFLVYDTINQDSVIIDTLTEITSNTEQIQSAIESKSGKNKYQYFRIPVMFGYRFNLNDNWFITPSVGVIVNYLISGSSTWFDSESQEFITYSSRDKYRSVVLAGRAKLDIGLNINNKWSVFVQPGYTRFFQSIYRKDESFKHYPYSYDLNVGVRYTFQ